MPSRRRPSDSSVRVRALLEAADRHAERGVPSPSSPSSGAPGSGGSPRGEVVPWLPDRTWIETGAATRAPEHAGRSRVERRGRHRRPVPPGPRFLAIPASLRGARLSGPRAAAAGLLLVVLLAAVGFGVRVAWAKAASTPQPVAPSQSDSALGSRRPSASGFASSSTDSGGGGPPTGTVTVHVVGQVARPGVFTMPAGSRVSDAVAKAGARNGADLAAINLARPVVDGEQIRVPKPGEVVAGGVGAAAVGAGGAGSAAGSGGGAVAGGSASGAAGRVNLNSASATELEGLPGVGPVLAQRIIDWRTQHGRFASVDELGEVSGIGEKIFAALQPKVTV